MYEVSYLIVDDFYRDPEKVRSYALSLPFDEAKTEREWKFYKGRLSSPNNAFAQLGLETISAVLNRGIVVANPCGEFRLLYQGRPDEPGGQTWVHTDSSVASYTGLVFLNPPEQCRGGLMFYKHRRLGIDRLPRKGSADALAVAARAGTTPEKLVFDLAEEGYDIERNWEVSDTIGMKFNRCVIFDARIFHARTERFGSHRGEARLTQNFFFNLSSVALPNLAPFKVDYVTSKSMVAAQ
jgi:hypothetical protein